MHLHDRATKEKLLVLAVLWMTFAAAFLLVVFTHF